MKEVVLNMPAGVKRLLVNQLCRSDNEALQDMGERIELMVSETKPTKLIIFIDGSELKAIDS